MSCPPTSPAIGDISLYIVTHLRPVVLVLDQLPRLVPSRVCRGGRRVYRVQKGGPQVVELRGLSLDMAIRNTMSLEGVVGGVAC